MSDESRPLPAAPGAPSVPEALQEGLSTLDALCEHRPLGEVAAAHEPREAALAQLRALALDLARAASERVLALDGEMVAISEHVRRTADEVGRDPARPLHERMLIRGLWAPLPTRSAPPPARAPRQPLQQRVAAARARQARAQGRP